MRPVLQQVADLVRRESGVVLRDSQENSLEAAVLRATGADPIDFLVLAEDSLAGPTALRRLIDEVTVQETYFLRERAQLEAIPWHALLAAARETGAAKVRVWVTACATGEEAYTLALLAARAFAPAPPPVDILATDISGSALERARRGLYRPRSVERLPAELRDRWLHRRGGEYEVDESLRALVRFRQHNLVLDPVPPLGESRFDVVGCRNVLIYFDKPTVKQVVTSLLGALSRDGVLLLGAADALCDSATRAATESSPAAKQRKRARPTLFRRPLGRAEAPLQQALNAADAGRTADALAAVARLLRAEPLDADAYFVRGLVELDGGDADRAVRSFRRALFVDPGFGLAAFKLGRAYDASGNPEAARRTYAQALRTLAPDEGRHEQILAQVDLGDVAAACRARLGSARSA
ncbi:MAG: chemotaxis protein methyltransferase CheR [Gaiellaceae bacterium]|nr:chemotaxis protein methyltransferase CheR [Gaiellaceae bacterium]